MIRLILFLLINFGALALGAFLMGGSPAENEWYQSLNQAPWTPPGWVFGAAWTTIMVCFSVFLWRASAPDQKGGTMSLINVFLLQLVLNIGWNPVFFAWHRTGLALVIIAALTILLFFWMMYGFKKFKGFGWLLVPYFLWLVIATSLNGYIVFNN